METLTQIAEDRISFFDGVAAVNDFSIGGKNALVDEVVRGLNREERIDWNEALRWANTFFDRLASISSMKDISKRYEACHQLGKKIQEIETGMIDPEGSLGSKRTPKELARTLGAMLLVFNASSTEQVLNAHWRAESHEKVIAITLASLNFRQQHERLPAAISDLESSFNTKDVFANSINGEPIEFNRMESSLQIKFDHPFQPDGFLDLEITIR